MIYQKTCLNGYQIFGWLAFVIKIQKYPIQVSSFKMFIYNILELIRMSINILKLIT